METGRIYMLSREIKMLNEVDFKSDYVRFLFLIAFVVNRNGKKNTPSISKTSKSFCKIAANNYFVSFIA